MKDKEEKKFKKTFICCLEAKALGISDIELILDKDINFPYFGLLIAEKISHDGIYEYISHFKQDEDKLNFKDTIAYKLLMNPSIPTICSSTTTEGNKTIEQYKLIYFNKDSGIFKPTVLYSYNRSDQVEAEITLEYLFVFDNEWIYSYEEILHLGPQNSKEESLYNVAKNITLDLSDIIYSGNINENHFLNGPSCSVIKNDKGEKTGIELEVCNLKGEFSTIFIKKENLDKLSDSICSIRIIDVKKAVFGSYKSADKNINEKLKTNERLII